MTVRLNLKQALRAQCTDTQLTLYRLAGVNLSAEEAWAAMPRIEHHKWYVSERLGRDVGLRVAAVDYFENIYETRARARTRKLNRLVKELAGVYLTHLTWKAHDGLFVQGPCV
jgi:hypothetical protein